MLRRLFKILCLFVLVVMGSSCGNNNLLKDSDDSLLSVVTWNAQTFFDGVMDGCEYSDFQKSGNWSNEKYQARLKRLCSVITELDADIYVFEEIENEGIIYDINNQLAGKNWKHASSWSYSCFAKPEGTAIGCGILSRFKLKNLSTHGMDIRVLNSEQPSMRYLLQVSVELEDRDLIVFANHWKSKSGGKEKTEIWRDWQESILAGRLLELDDGGFPEDVILCGDFNREAEDFFHFKNNVQFRFSGFSNKKNVSLISPWFSEQGEVETANGSYFYQNQWEKIDHIFYSNNLDMIMFAPCNNSTWVTSEGYPYSYSIFTGNGYSDHLPLKAVFKLH